MAKPGNDGIRKSLAETNEIGWLGSLKDGLKFCVFPRRFLPFMLSDIAALLIVLMVANTSGIITLMENYAGGSISPDIVYSVAAVVFIFILWAIVNIWITGAVIHQSVKPREFKESWQVAFRRMHSLILAMVVVSIISFALSLIPYIGSTLSAIVAIIFLLVNQFIIVSGLGFAKALAGSVKTFRKKIVSMFIAWALSGIVAAIIIGIFTIPLILLSLTVDPLMQSEDILSLLLLNGNPAMLFVAGGLFLLGMSFSRVFSIKFLTDVYVQFKKKKWLFF